MSRLHIDSILKHYQLRPVLTDVYLHCDKGEIVGLLGRNGSGKSTLLRIIFGSLQAERRFVRVGESVITGVRGSRGLINYLPQHHFLPKHIRIDKMIDLYCTKENAMSMKEHTLVQRITNKTAEQLSTGEKRFLEILLIISSEAPYVLLDEPFNGVSPIHREEVMGLIARESRNKGFIITDHDYRNILAVATRSVLVYDGCLKPILDPTDLARWGYISS